VTGSQSRNLERFKTTSAPFQPFLQPRRQEEEKDDKSAAGKKLRLIDHLYVFDFGM
jgi:hypothetical protein